MKTIQLLLVSLFLFSLTVNSQSKQENPFTSKSVIGYLKIPDIEGESKSSEYKNEIEIFGLASLIEKAGKIEPGRGRSQSRAQMSSISLVKNIDAATPYLMLANLQGKSFKEAVISLVKSEKGSKKPFLILTLKKTIINKHQIDSSSNRQEIVSLSFEKITIKYINNGQEHEVTYNLAGGV